MQFEGCSDLNGRVNLDTLVRLADGEAISDYDLKVLIDEGYVAFDEYGSLKLTLRACFCLEVIT